MRCAVCSAETHPALLPVRPNLRSLRHERFHVWRCAGCGSLHTHEVVDLARYYQEYRFEAGEGAPLDWPTRRMLRPQLARLERAGVRREHAILDFGCGSGKLVRYLRERGYARACGYDAYAPRFRDPSLLERRWDVVFAQDVLEHAEDPWEMLRTFDRLLVPGGLVLIGTPNAARIDPAQVERYVHSLHVPFHRHILSEGALRDAGARLGWSVVGFHRSVHDTPFPCLNYRYILFYMASWDNTLDALGQLRLNLRLVLHPLAWFYAFFGALVPTGSECQILFRTAGGGARAE